MTPPAHKVSTIILTYNQEGSIAEAIESALAQECPFGHEIVVSDDCSHDSTPMICRDYADFYPDRVRFRQTPRNMGLVPHYYDTLAMCRGEYICDLAGDDRWTDPGKTARQASLLDAHPEVLITHAAWHWRDINTGQRSPGIPDAEMPPAFTPPGAMVGEILNRQGRPAIHLSTSMYRREAALGAYSDYPALFQAPWLPCEDLQLTAVLAQRGSVAFTPESTLDYTVGGDSVSSARDLAKSFDFTLGTLRLRLAIADTLGLPRRDISPAIGHMLDYLLGIAYIENYHARLDTLLTFCRDEGIALSRTQRAMLATKKVGPLRAVLAPLRRRLAGIQRGNRP